VDDKRGLSGIIFINRNGLRWRDAPAEYGSHKTPYSRWKRCSEKGIFARVLLELADQSGGTDALMIDATHLKTHRTACLPPTTCWQTVDTMQTGIAKPLKTRGSRRAYLPKRTARLQPPFDEARYRKRHKIEKSFARLKDWRQVATRYDWCPRVFLSACALAAVVMFWLLILTLSTS
jgi:transposase